MKAISFLLLALLLCGCASTDGPLPVSLTAPGWNVRQGQALWRPDGKSPEVAGDIVLSTHATGGSSIQFLKTLPILNARTWSGGWRFENVAEGKEYSGGGNPPARVAWLQLLLALEGRQVSERWVVARPSERFISLENERNGERLQVQFQD